MKEDKSIPAEVRLVILQARCAALESEVAALRQALQLSYGAQWEAAPAPSAPGVCEAFDNMTVKQRAAIIAMLNGVSFQRIAEAMGADPTTVKLHAKAAYTKLGVTGRAELLARAGDLLDELRAANPGRRWGVPLDWVDTRPAALMASLQKSRATLPPPGGARKV